MDVTEMTAGSDKAPMAFDDVCSIVEEIFEEDWKTTDEMSKGKKLDMEKKAIMGFEKETTFYKERIRAILQERGYSDIDVPAWYKNAEEGIFAQLYGLAGLAPWAYDETEKYSQSSSAKLIGEKLFCLIDGKSQLQPQTIEKRRREQLKRALLLATPKERLEEGFHEIYLHNGIRITIFSGDRTKDGQDVMVFRKYILKDLTFEKLAELGTIPEESIELFKIMVKIGFNVLFAGQVRSGKTAFLQTWQRYEDPTLEGLAIATDPETPWHTIMPEAPVMQLIADGAKLEGISKSLLRGDNDYVLLEEMRDAAAFNIALDITSTGTMRSKATIHDGDGANVPYKMAAKIKEKYGGDLRSIISQVFKNFNYVFEFYQLPHDRGKKRLKAISEYRYDVEKDAVSVHRICKYDSETGRWQWKRDLGQDKWEIAIEYEMEMKRMEEILKELEMRNPIKGNSVIYPRYYLPAKGEEGEPKW